MLTTAPQLHIRRPSPTTAEFTVSTCPPLTLPLRALLALTILLRLTLALAVLLLLHSAWILSPFSTPPGPCASAPGLFTDDFIWHSLWRVHASALGTGFTAVAASVPTWILLPACGVALYTSVVRAHTSESLLVLRGLGMQTASSGATYLVRASTRFIPTEKIRDVLINEAFRGFEVRYYLVVVVEGEEDVVVVFPKLLPGRRIVEAVWRGVRGCLYEPEGGRKGDEKG